MYGEVAMFVSLHIRGIIAFFATDIICALFIRAVAI